MPSSEAHTLRVLAQQLFAAGSAQDWERLGQLDALVAQCLQQAPSQLLLAEWALVRQAHAQALTACKLARDQAHTELRNLQNSQEAQKAYAWQQVLE